MLDLDYTEDFTASTDLNCVMTEDGKLVELQATAEGAPYTRAGARRDAGARAQGHQRADRRAEARDRHAWLSSAASWSSRPATRASCASTASCWPSTGLELIAFDTEVDEVGETYEENARLKAETAAARSGLPSLGDDSGVEVEALGGFPGIRSARLGPTQEERTAELMRRLEGKARPWNARFVCVLALADPGKPHPVLRGGVPGGDRAGVAGRGGLRLRPCVPGAWNGEDVWGDEAGGEAAVQPSGSRGPCAAGVGRAGAPL